MYTHWNYRIVARVEYTDAMRGRGYKPLPLFEICEVYYNDEGKPASWAQGKALCQNHDSVKSLSEEHHRMTSSFTKPVLWLQNRDDGKSELVEFSDYRGLLSTYDRILGCLLGCALGDAIGAPVEMHDADHIQSYIDNHVVPDDYEGVVRDYGNHPFGQVTDDTQCMRLIAQSIDDKGQFDGATFAQKLVSFFQNPGLVGYGSNTHKAIQALASGVPWTSSGNPAPSDGNGAAMRAAILGVAGTKFWYEGNTRDWTPFVKVVEDSCIATHASEAAIFGAQIVAGLAWLVSHEEGEVLASKLVLSKLLIGLKPFYGHLDMFQDYMKLVGILDLDTEYERHQGLYDLVSSVQPYDSSWPGVSPYVRSSILWSVGSFLLHPENFKRLMCMALSIGGDVDTTCAVAGSLFGCYNGTASLDRNLLDLLQDRGSWVLSDYISLARNLSTKVC